MATLSFSTDEVRFQVDRLLELLDCLELRIRKVPKRIEQRVEITPEAQLLLSVPGIGAKTAMLIMAEIGTLDRFPSSHHLTSFAGLVRAHFTRLTRARGNSRATVAAARRLCSYLFWMLKEGRTYPDWLQNRLSQPLLEVRPT